MQKYFADFPKSSMHHANIPYNGSFINEFPHIFIFQSAKDHWVSPCR